MEKNKATPNKSDNATQKNNANKSTIDQENKTNKAADNSNLDLHDQSLKDDSSAMEQSNLGADLEGQDDEKSIKEGATIESDELLPIDDHPYKDLLLNFELTPDQLSPVQDIVPPKAVDDTPLIEITKREELEEFIKELKKEKEIGVDLQYSNLGYVGTTCIISISTKEKDYIIDSITLKNDIILLNDVFLDANIVKIVHASSKDLMWLQQEFKVFVINLFDTRRALVALGYTHGAVRLDAALQEYKVEDDSNMIRADFRKRPLPPKYKKYARIGSHYLIHMYQKFKNRLIEAKALEKVLHQCNNECRVVYGEAQDSAYTAIRNEMEQVYTSQMVALEKLNQWRHRIAEYDDVGVDLVMSKYSMKSLAVAIPCDPEVILTICERSKYVHKHITEIVEIMKEARPKSGPGKFRFLIKNMQLPSRGRVGDYVDSPKRPRLFYSENGSAIRGRGRGSGIGNGFYSRGNWRHWNKWSSKRGEH